MKLKLVRKYTQFMFGRPDLFGNTRITLWLQNYSYWGYCTCYIYENYRKWTSAFVSTENISTVRLLCGYYRTDTFLASLFGNTRLRSRLKTSNSTKGNNSKGNWCRVTNISHTNAPYWEEHADVICNPYHKRFCNNRQKKLKSKKGNNSKSNSCRVINLGDINVPH